MAGTGRRSWLIEGIALAVALAAAALIGAALLRGPRAAVVSVADLPDGGGLALAERQPDGSAYRWTADEAHLLLPNPGGRLIVELALAAGGDRSAVAELSGPLSAALPLGPAPRRYLLLAPAQPAERVALRLRTPTFQPPGEPRLLGAQLFGVALRGTGGAPAHALLALLAATAACYVALRVALRPAAAAAFAPVPALALLLWCAARWPAADFAPAAGLLALIAPLVAAGWLVITIAAERWRAAPVARARPALVAVLALAYLAPVLWNQSAVHPRLDSDLGIYLEAARELLAGGSPYDILRTGRIVIGESFVYPPATLPIFVALALVGEDAARAIWLIGSLALYLFALLSVYAAVPGPLTRGTLWALLGLGLAFGPFLETLAIGQINSLIILGLALFIHGQRDRRVAWAGDIALAAAVLIKLTPGLLLLWPLVRGDWPRLARVALAAAALALPSLLLFGLVPWVQFTGLLPILLAGVPRNPFNQSLVGALSALAAPGSPAEAAALWVGRLASLLLLGSFAAACWLRRRTDDGGALAYGVAALTVGSSLIWYHHLTFLAIPLAWLAIATPGGRRGRAAAVAGLALIQLTRPLEAVLGPPAWAAVAGYLIVVLALAAHLLGPQRRSARAAGPAPEPR